MFVFPFSVCFHIPDFAFIHASDSILVQVRFSDVILNHIFRFRFSYKFQLSIYSTIHNNIQITWWHILQPLIFEPYCRCCRVQRAGESHYVRKFHNGNQGEFLPLFQDDSINLKLLNKNIFCITIIYM